MKLDKGEWGFDLPGGRYIYVCLTPLEASLHLRWRLLAVSLTPTCWKFSFNTYWDNSKWLRAGPLWIVWQG